ncbi:hypothetical protein B5X24_HaOG214480 [Helicoverpa armigera]|nr:hypothetical protein B5X24_HaOG214480 [Helicoverpa armigera]
MFDSVGRSAGSYTSSYGIDQIRKHVAEYIECRDGHKCRMDDCVLTGGASSGIKNCLQLLVNQVRGKDTALFLAI